MNGHGGRRQGAGRKAGGRNGVIPSAFLPGRPPDGVRYDGSGPSAAEYLAGLVGDETQPTEIRLAAARALLPFQVAKPGGRISPEAAARDAIEANPAFAPGLPPTRVGRKERAQIDAMTAHEGTPWEKILS